MHGGVPVKGHLSLSDFLKELELSHQGFFEKCPNIVFIEKSTEWEPSCSWLLQIPAKRLNTNWNFHLHIDEWSGIWSRVIFQFTNVSKVFTTSIFNAKHSKTTYMNVVWVYTQRSWGREMQTKLTVQKTQ
jgi:hypothetical protein